MEEILDPTEDKRRILSSDRIWLYHKNLIPLLLLALFALCTAFGLVIDSYHTLSTYHVIGFVLLLTSFVSYFWFRKYFKFVVIVFVGLGLFHIASVNMSTIESNLFGVNFHPLFFLVALYYYAMNFKAINDRIMPQGDRVDPETAKLMYYQSEVEKYRNQFAQYSKQQLEQVIQKETSLKAAKEAARELLEGM